MYLDSIGIKVALSQVMGIFNTQQDIFLFVNSRLKSVCLLLSLGKKEDNLAVLVPLIIGLTILISSTLVIIGYSINSFKGHFDFHYLRIFLIALYFCIWNLTRIFFSIDQYSSILENSLMIIILRIGNIFLFMSFLTIGYLLQNTSFGERTRGFATAGIVFIGGAATLLLTDFFDQSAIIFGVEGDLITTKFGFLFSLFLSLGAVFLAIAYIFAVRSLRKLPKTIHRSNFRYEFITLLIVATLLITWNLFDYSNILTGFEFNIILSGTMNIFYLVIFYYLFNQPFFQFNMGLSVRNIVKGGYMGYFLGAVTDYGPELLTYSKGFTDKVGITEMDIETLNVGATTALGINFQMQDKIAVLPVSNKMEFSVIIFSFRSKYEGINDDRIKESTMVILGIIVPSSLMVNISNISKAQDNISSYLSQHEKLNDIVNSDDMEEIVINCLNYLTI